MKIETVETFIVTNWLIVRIRTDNGLEGVGESTFFGWPGATQDVVRSFEGYLVGNDPLNIEHHWNWMFRNKAMRGGAIGGAISAIDQALWDIKGKRFDAPVWQLLGGKVRPKVRAMLVLGTGSRDEVAAQAKAAAAEGYTAVKVLLHQDEHHQMRHGAKIQDLVERATAIREAIGWDVDMGLELHRNMVPGEAIALVSELEKLRPYFVKDPIAPDSVLSFGETAARMNVPMAAGERNLNMWEFREYVEHGNVQFIRPDVGIAGGITHVKKICALAEAHHQGIIPHTVPNGPIAVAAAVNLGVSVPNWDAQGHRPQEEPPFSDAVKEVIELKDGWLLPRDEPGLGIEFDEEGAKKHPGPPPTGQTSLRYDGSIAIR